MCHFVWYPKSPDEGATIVAVGGYNNIQSNKLGTNDLV